MRLVDPHPVVVGTTVSKRLDQALTYLDDAGGQAIEGDVIGRLDRAAAIQGLSKRVDDTTPQGLAITTSKTSGKS